MKLMERLFGRSKTTGGLQFPSPVPPVIPPNKTVAESSSHNPKVEVGLCVKCRRPLRVRSNGVRKEMQLTCKCGQQNMVRRQADTFIVMPGMAMTTMAKEDKMPPGRAAGSLVQEIMNTVPVTIENLNQQTERIAALIKFGPGIISEIETAIRNGATYENNVHAYQNAGLLLEAIGKIGGPRASEILSEFATRPSDIAEYRYLRAGAEKGLSFLGYGDRETKVLRRDAIPGLIDIAEKQAKAGECLSAVRTFLQAAEIEPVFMMSSAIWSRIGAVFTGVAPHRYWKSSVALPKELISDQVLAQLARLPNYSISPGYTGPDVEPPTEAEIRKLIADLRGILKRFAESSPTARSISEQMSDIPVRQECGAASELRAASDMSDQEMVAVLRRLCAAYASDDPVKRELEPIATEIGGQLDRRGGIREMRRIFDMLEGSRGARTLDMHWNGIGDWRG